MNNMIEELKENQIFVFGSNLKGNHIGGAAKLAHEKFGAIMGQATGQQGKSYAIATLDEKYKKVSLASIQSQLYLLSEEAKKHPEQEYLLTPIGTGIAGFFLKEIKEILPQSFPKNVVLIGNWTEKMTQKEFAQLGGIARAKKYTKEQISKMGQKGGRPRKKKLSTRK